MNGSASIQILCMTLLLVLVANVASEAWSRRLDQMDHALIRDYFGPVGAIRIENEVTHLMSTGSTPRGSSFEDFFTEGSPGSLSLSPDFQAFQVWTESRLHLAERTAERFFRRLVVLMEFNGLGLLITGLCALDGLLQRQVRRTNFAYSSPLAHRITIFTFGGLLSLFPLALITPLPFLPDLVPFLWLLMGWTLHVHLTHLPKRL